MSRYARDSQGRDYPSTSGGAGRSGYRRSPEPEYRQGRQPERNGNQRAQRGQTERDDSRRQYSDNDEGDMSPEPRDRSPDNRERRPDQKQERSRQTRGRWKDAGEDQLRVEKRHARLDRMNKVMKLFEDSLLIDKVSLKERKPLMEDVRERLDEMKKEHAERMKEQVTSHWSKLTEEGRASRDRRSQDEDDSPPRNKPRLDISGEPHNGEKNRYRSGESGTRNGRDHSGDDRYARNDDRGARNDEGVSDDDGPRYRRPRIANSSDSQNRSRNRVDSSEPGYNPKGHNRRDRRNGYSDNNRNYSPR